MASNLNQWTNTIRKDGVIDWGWLGQRTADDFNELLLAQHEEDIQLEPFDGGRQARSCAMWLLRRGGAGIVAPSGWSDGTHGFPDDCYRGPYTKAHACAPILFCSRENNEQPRAIGFVFASLDQRRPDPGLLEQATEQKSLPVQIRKFFQRTFGHDSFPEFTFHAYGAESKPANGDSMGLSILLASLSWLLGKEVDDRWCSTGAWQDDRLCTIEGLEDKMAVARLWGYTDLLVVKEQFRKKDGQVVPAPPPGLQIHEIDPDPAKAIVEIAKLLWEIDLSEPDGLKYLPTPLACCVRDTILAAAKGQGFFAAHLVRRLYDLLVQNAAMLAAAGYLQRPDRTESLDSSVFGHVVGVISPDYPDWVHTLEQAAAQISDPVLPGLSNWINRWSIHFKSATGWRATASRGRSPDDNRKQLNDAISRWKELRPILESFAGLLTTSVLIGRGSDGLPRRWMGLMPTDGTPPNDNPDLCLWSNGIRALHIQPLARIGTSLNPETDPGHLWYLEELRETGQVTWFDPATNHIHVVNDPQGNDLLQRVVRGIPAHARTLDPHGVERQRRHQAEFAALQGLFNPNIQFRTRDRICNHILGCTGGYLLLTGPSGAGKSFLADHLAKSAHQSDNRVGCLIHPDHPNVVMPVLLAKARREMGSHASVLLPELFNCARGHAWLAKWLADTGQTISNQPAISKDINETRLSISRWIAELLDILPGHRLLLIIDGLDEMDPPPTGGHEFLECLPAPEALPLGCVILLSSRELADCREKVRLQVGNLLKRDCDHLRMDPNDHDYKSDLLDWISKRQERNDKAIRDPELIQRIVDSANGCWRYVQHFLDVLETGLFDNPQDFPTLANWYPAYFSILRSRLGPELFDAVHGRVLVTLAIAQLPLGFDDLANFGIRRSILRHALFELNAMIDSSLDQAGRRVFRVVNEDLQQCLKESPLFDKARAKARAAMVNWLFDFAKQWATTIGDEPKDEDISRAKLLLVNLPDLMREAHRTASEIEQRVAELLYIIFFPKISRIVAVFDRGTLGVFHNGWVFYCDKSLAYIMDSLPETYSSIVGKKARIGIDIEYASACIGRGTLDRADQILHRTLQLCDEFLIGNHDTAEIQWCKIIATRLLLAAMKGDGHNEGTQPNESARIVFHQNLISAARDLKVSINNSPVDEGVHGAISLIELISLCDILRFRRKSDKKKRAKDTGLNKTLHSTNSEIIAELELCINNISGTINPEVYSGRGKIAALRVLASAYQCCDNIAKYNAAIKTILTSIDMAVPYRDMPIDACCVLLELTQGKIQKGWFDVVSTWEQAAEANQLIFEFRKCNNAHGATIVSLHRKSIVLMESIVLHAENNMKKSSETHKLRNSLIIAKGKMDELNKCIPPIKY